MTPENAKALLPIITAYAEGKTIQFRLSGGWEDRTDCSFSYESERYRIKPESKLVPMTSDDLPPVFWVRKVEGSPICYVVQAFDPDDGQLWYDGTEYFKQDRYHEWEWSSDRKTWNSFMKEVAE